jgi:hypothetical protein
VSDFDSIDCDGRDGIAAGQELATELEVAFLPLFPDGKPDEELASKWQELFEDGES